VNALDAAISAGLDFVLRGQHNDGRFVDWALPPGPASAWPTAYVGLVLAELSEAGSGAMAAAHAAARWLLAHPAPGGGWGYNEVVDADADSTGCALRLLARAGLPIASAHLACLLSFQRADGGFATYGPEDGLGAWGRSHVDVSAGCALALAAARAPSDALRRCVDFVATRRQVDGTWPSFWWRTPWYATHAALSLLQFMEADATTAALAIDWRTLAPLHPFERALALESALLVSSADAPLDTTLASLLSDQRLDGSWPDAPVLRLARRDCDQPWVVTGGGPLFGDPRRLFTTITVVRGLAAARRGCEAAHCRRVATGS
jgi:hypothetical protein